MNVSLTPELEKYVHQKVKSQQYQTASEVIREALRVLQLHESFSKMQVQALRREIQVGIDQMDRGEYIEIENEKDQKALLKRITDGGRSRLAAKQRRKSA